jgi:TrpR-related protein YerC/YecD
MSRKFQNENIDFLFKAVLALENQDECYDFFEDLFTVQELRTISQRLVVAKMLSENCVYTDIVNATGASTATISRVNRSLQYGSNGYDRIFERIRENKDDE